MAFPERAKQTGTTRGRPPRSAVARRPTRASRSIARAHAGASARSVTGLFGDELRPLVEQRKDDVAALRRQQQERARGAGLAEVVELGLVGRGGEDRHGDRLQVATLLRREIAQLVPGAQERFGVAAAREPA